MTVWKSLGVSWENAGKFPFFRKDGVQSIREGEISVGSRDVLSRLKYRRQFLVARGNISELASWRAHRFGDYFLFYHPDLDFDVYSEGGKSLAVVGSIFDPDQPEN